MNILLVDDEEQVLKGVKRIISCEEDEWEVETALSGEEALKILERQPIDVIVSDMRMPGMDGAQLLDIVLQEYPSILRVVLSGQADRESVLRSVKPMHQYLSKPCDPEKLFEVINRAEIFQETIQSAEVLDAIGAAGCLPSFPSVIDEINREVESEDGTAKSIGEVISKDPILAARLLQLANSAIFSLNHQIATIDKAVSIVGLDMIRALAMSQAVFADNQDNDRILSAKQQLDHGFLVAVTGKQIAKHVGFSSEDSNLVFSAGLLHDVGKLILLHTFPERYAAVIKQSKQQGECLESIEMDAFGATHQGIGGYLFGIWGLPAEVIESVASHHSFEACALAPGKPRQVVFASNWIVRKKTDSELQQLVDESKSPEAAIKFADQIRQWTQYLSSIEE